MKKPICENLSLIVETDARMVRENKHLEQGVILNDEA